MTRACCILYIEHLWSLRSGELSSLLSSISIFEGETSYVVKLCQEGLGSRGKKGGE